MKDKTAILIVSIDDTNLSNHADNKDKIALDYSIILNSNHKLKYLFDDVPNTLRALPYDIARSWYRDLNGKDNHGDKYSLGMLLETRVGLMVSNIVKIYYGFSSLSNNYQNIEVPKNYPKYLSKIINIFQHKITLINDQQYSSDFNSFFKNRSRIKEIKVNIYSSLFRILQKPFMKLLRRKTMIFPDWTYVKQKNKKYLSQNKLNIFKSFYFKDINIDNNIFDYSLVNDNKVKSILLNYNIKPKDISNLASLVTDIINDVIKDSYEAIGQQYNILNELLLYYCPSKIIIPDDGRHPRYNMLMQVADSLNINVVTVLDGYLTYMDKNDIRIKEDGISPLVKNYATMGTLNHDLVGSVYPKFNRILIKTPLADYLDNKSNLKSQYDVLIMMPVPKPLYLNSRWDMINKYIIDVVNIITTMGITKIAIKIKPGLALNNISFLQNYMIRNGLKDVHFLNGYAYEAIAISKIIIGQLGTTLYESSLMGKPYYIYEPIDAGLDDDDIKNSVTSIDYISRDINELSNNISNKNNVKLPIKELTDGPEMSVRIN